MDQFEVKKAYLKRYSRIVKRIERLEEKKKQMDDRMFSIGSGQITDMPRGSTPVTLDEQLARKEETEQRIERLVQRSRKIRRETYAVIDQLEDYRMVEILEWFFIYDLRMEDVAERAGFHVRHTTRLYTEAIHLLTLPDDDSDVSVT